MDGENNVINDGNVMVRDGKITGVWASNSNPPAGVNFADVPIVNTEGTIYPGLIDLHNHVHYNHIPLWDIPCLDESECERYEDSAINKNEDWDMLEPHRDLLKAVTPIDISGVIIMIMGQVLHG